MVKLVWIPNIAQLEPLVDGQDLSPTTLAPTVAFANAAIHAAGRRMDWVNIPTLDVIEDSFSVSASIKTYTLLPLNRSELERILIYLKLFLTENSIAVLLEGSSRV